MSNCRGYRAEDDWYIWSQCSGERRENAPAAVHRTLYNMLVKSSPERKIFRPHKLGEVLCQDCVSLKKRCPGLFWVFKSLKLVRLITELEVFTWKSNKGILVFCLPSLQDIYFPSRVAMEWANMSHRTRVTCIQFNVLIFKYMPLQTYCKIWFS